MTDLEKIEDMYPELRFWYIDVPDPAYHGHIENGDVYLNRNQDDLDWLITALHEASHYENDVGNYNSRKEMATLKAEKWAVRESKMKYKQIFGYDFYKTT